MRWKRWLITGLCALGVAGAEQAGQVRFTVPPGWTLRMQEGVAQLTPEGLPSGETAFLTVGMGADFTGDFAAWFEKVTGGVPQGYRVVSRSDVVRSQDAGGVPLLGRSVTLQDGAGGQFYLFYVAANPRGRAELMFFTASSLQTFRRYQPGLTALTGSVQFLGASGGPTPAAGGAAPVATAGGALPPMPAPDMAALAAQGTDFRKRVVPDEFRCYLEANSDQWQKPVFALQMLPNGGYRVPGGTGTYTLRQDSSLTKVRFTGGQLAGTDDSYIGWDKKSGQSIEIQNYPLRDGDSVDIFCYQRGAREEKARDLFRRKDPQPGKYPCRSTDGKNTDLGTLELLPGRGYRYKGGTGSYGVGVLLEQDRDYTGPRLNIKSGPLEDTYLNYFEKEDGEREIEFLRNGRCAVVVKPTPLPKFGPRKAPAPPRGYGGIQGDWFVTRNIFYPSMSGGGYIKPVPYFYFFDRSGYVYTDDPDEGMEETDCSRTYPSGVPVCELYRIQGGKLGIGKDQPEPYTLRGGELTLDGEKMIPITPLSDLRLEGAYKKITTFTPVIGTGGGLWEDIITFRRDSTFRRQKSGGVSITTTTDGTSFGDPTAFVGTSSDRRNGGRYAFAGNTLTLTYGDGRVERLFAFLPVPGKSPEALEWLQLSAGDYFLQDGK